MQVNFRNMGPKRWAELRAEIHRLHDIRRMLEDKFLYERKISTLVELGDVYRILNRYYHNRKF